MSVITATLDLARSRLGVKEKPKGSNKTPFGEWFGWNGVAWCAIFLSWVYAHSGLTYLGKPWRFASTVAARDHAKRNGRWHTTPRVGAVAMRAHTARTGHVGIVEAIGPNWVDTIEGNTNGGGSREGDSVMRKRRSLRSWDGYIYMDDVESAPVPPPAPKPQPAAQPTPGKPYLEPDGVFNPATIHTLQVWLNNHGAKLKVDGQFGQATKEYLQAYLNHVVGPVLIDGHIGPKTIRALQRRLGILEDGMWGPNTTKALQIALNNLAF